MTLTVVDPRTAQPIEDVAEHGPRAVARRIARSEEASGAWRQASLRERAERLHAVADRLETEERRHAETITSEMGKPVRQAVEEVRRCARLCRETADHAPMMLHGGDADAEAEGEPVHYDPVGPVLAIMPWTHPYWQVFRTVVPSIMAGGTVLLRPAPNTPGCGEAVERLFLDAGLPEGVLQTLLIDDPRVQDVLEDDRVRGVAYVEGPDDDPEIVTQVAALDKRTMVERGGVAAFVVLDGADIDQAARVAAEALCDNTGQSDMAPRRFIVVEKLHGAFRRRLEDEVDRHKVGDPMGDDTEVGPLARHHLLEHLADQVDRSIKTGATAHTGAHRIDHLAGFYYAPTVFGAVTEETPVWQEALCGPVACVMAAEDTEDALARANRTQGTAVSLWGDSEQIEQVAGRFDAETVLVERLPYPGRDADLGMTLAFVDVRTPR